MFITLNKNATEELKQPYNKEQPNDSIKSNRKNNRMNYNVANKCYEHLMKRALKLVLKLKLNILKT